VAETESGIVLEHAGEAVCLEGRATRALLPALLPLLDGSRTVDEIAVSLGERARPAVEQALAILLEHGLLTEGPSLAETLPEPFAAAALVQAARLGISPSAARALLERADALLIGSSRVAAEISRLLRSSGFGSVALCGWDEDMPEADVVVAAPAPVEEARLAAWNESALATGLSWLQVLPFDGAFAAVGPLYVPGETCCYECYRLRRGSNVEYPDEFWPLESVPSAVAEAPAATALIAGTAAVLAIRWALERDPQLPATMTAVELGQSLGITTHAVYRVPRCPACSEFGSAALPLPWAEAS
jgi:bacteriocin biosynthesis cyclodehydratase domain-containing protein